MKLLGCLSKPGLLSDFSSTVMLLLKCYPIPPGLFGHSKPRGVHTDQNFYGGKGWWMGKGVAVKDASSGVVIKDLSKNIFKQGWVKAKAFRRGVEGVTTPAPAPAPRYHSCNSFILPPIKLKLGILIGMGRNYSHTQIY